MTAQIIPFPRRSRFGQNIEALETDAWAQFFYQEVACFLRYECSCITSDALWAHIQYRWHFSDNIGEEVAWKAYTDELTHRECIAGCADG